jgi:two-component system response regulator PilR (NtrC family)
MESEFFGHKRGSFTGAVSDSRGLLQASEGGTLFLDEVADLPLHMQVKLLRVIQEKSVRPIGESQEVPLDVRVLSATHRDLRALVAEGRFREDLYYRINVIELKVPPLRERTTDIKELAEHLLARLAQRAGIPAPALTAAALQGLQAHGFPGNVRELENILERAFTLSDGKQIDADDLLLRADNSDDEDSGDALDEQLSSVERDAIVRALQQSRYNKTAAAKLLGISFRTLRYRIKKLGIE